MTTDPEESEEGKMKSGTCPRCGGKNVHDGSGATFKPGPPRVRPAEEG